MTIGYSEYLDAEERETLKLAGVKSCVSRRDSPGKLLEAVVKLLGNSTIQTEKEKILRTLGGVREQEVFTLLGSGCQRKEIAAVLRINPRTVDTYLARIKINLGLTSMQELRHLAHGYDRKFHKEPITL